MQRAALAVMQAIHEDETQEKGLGLMQPREELYDFLDYRAYEERLDRLSGEKA